MKVGDLITYKQSPDNQVYPCPWTRMGIIISIGPGRLKEFGDEFKVYWYDSGTVAHHVEEYLEIAR